MQQLSLAQARRVAVAAQGLARRPTGAPTARSLDRVIGHTGLLQIDSVNVLARAHLLPVFSRLGPYDPTLLQRATDRSPRRLVEYWAHCAAYIPPSTWPLLHHRMQAYAARGHAWFGLPDQPDLPDRLIREIEQHGPATARDLDDGSPRTKEHWGWNWSATKKALEYLFFSGRLAVARRTTQFERVYDLPERVLPASALASVPAEADAIRDLVRLAARSHGIATRTCLRDYYRLATNPAPNALLDAALHDLVDTGELIAVSVPGWTRTAYLYRDARLPRRVHARALLAPFDPLIWERRRTEGIFGFRYRIGIYTPAAQREHGYYVLPFLLGDQLVARVDLKADRSRGALVVQSAHAEVDAPEHTASELVLELGQLARWLGLVEIEVRDRGDLAAALRSALG